MAPSLMRGILILCLLGTAVSQKIAFRDPEIEGMVNEIDVEQLIKVTKGLDSFQNRNTFSDTQSDTFGIGAARRWIFQTMAESIPGSPDLPGGGKALSVTFDVCNCTVYNRPVQVINVIGILAGLATGDAACSVIISGHYDSINSNSQDATGYAPGANDDGSGVTIAMEALRVMSQYQYQCTIFFVAFAAEEQGLHGAHHLADLMDARGEPVYAMLNNDIVGGGGIPSSGTGNQDNSRVRIFSRFGTTQQGEVDGPSRAVARAMKEVGERYVDYLEPVLIYRNDRYGRGGDHRPFGDKGWGVVRVTEINENFQRQHQDVRIVNGTQYGDLPETLDHIYMQKVTGINLATAAVLAKAPQPPRNARLLSQGLENTSTVTWAHPAGLTPAGYYLCIRETTAPYWEKKIFYSYPQTSATVSLSKDNFFFGVQSVDEIGNESLAVFVSM